MQRRRHGGLCTTGGTVQGPEPRHPIASDSEDDETWRCPTAGNTASPQVVPESDPEEPDVCPDIRVLRKRRPTPALGLHTDLAQSRLDPDVGGPKKRRLCPKTTPAPDVGSKTAISDIRPQNHSPDPKGQVDPDVKHLGGSTVALGIESDTDDEVHPKSALFHPNRHQAALEASGDPNVEKRGPNPGAEGAQNGRWMLAVDSDTDVEEADVLPSVGCPKIRRKAHRVPKAPGVEMKPPNPDAGSSKNGFQTLVVDSDTDVEMESSNSAVEDPQRGHQAPRVDSDTDVEEGGANPAVGLAKTPQMTENTPNSSNIKMKSPRPAIKGPHKEHPPLTVGSDTDVEEDKANPDVVCLPTPQTTQNAPKPPNIEMETPNPDADGCQKENCMLVVDSDTDVEDNILPDVVSPKPHAMTPRDPGVETRGQDAEGPKMRRQSPLVDSDTDVDEDPSSAEARDPKPHQITQNAQRNLDAEMQTLSPRPGEPQSGHEMLKVDSDTDVDEDPSDPEGRDPKPHQITQNAQRNTDVEMETPSPHPGEPQSGHEMLKVDSDTDEEDGLNPDVGCPETHRMTPKIHSDSDVAIKTPNPDLEGPQNRGQNLEVDSDTDVEGEDLNPDIPGLKNHKTPQNAQKDPTVVMETPNPDVVGLHRGSMPPGSDSDTDVEGLEDIETPKTHRTTREVIGMGAKNAAAPDVDPRWHAWTKGGLNVEGTAPNLDVGQHMDLNVDSDTGVEDNGVVPDAGAVQGGQGAPGHPDVVMAPLDPDVSPPMTPQSGSDTDVEEVAPTPYVRSLRSKTRPRNPDVVDTAMGSDTNVGLTDPKCQKPAQKRQSLPPKSCSDGGVEGEVPKQHDLAPNRDAEDPNPDDKVQHNPQTSVMGSDTDVAPAGLAPKSPILAPDLSLSGDAAWGSRSAQATPHGDTDAEVAESETEDDPDLFLEPTQSFLPPPVTEADAALGWDPEEATQLFCHPKLEEEEEEEEKEKEEEEKQEEEEEKKEEEEEKEEEEKEEEPPQDIPATRVPPAELVVVTPAQEGAGTGAAPSGDVTEGPRRSQRLARGHGGRAPRGGRASAVGGASGGGVASQARGGALPRPTPPRRSPRLQACPSPAEPPAKKGRGQEEPRPPPRPRPKRSGHAPSQKQTREEEEPPEVAGLQLRPRGGAGSSSPKVLFTGVVASQDMEVALGSLGGSMATSVFDCTHLVTDRVRRTVKFLCAVARGIPIVTPKWLHESARSGRVLAPGSFLVRDSQQERHFGFSLSQALSHARRHPLLQGYEVHVTPSVRPEPEQMRDIVTCSGGTFLPTMPCTYGPRRLVISCGEDSGCWAPVLSARLPLASAELLLTGLLRQRLQLQDFLLAPPEIPPGPSGVPQDPPPKSPQPPPASPRHLRAPPPTQGRMRRDPPSTRRHPQPRNK
ncbi:mediator of DNA damage checkpoint protein 1 isoform X3 [Cygnus atratus]|uniref:mediator of DNA damage checkpoint protein 1 isoform X3 n=1 Tax=Cygnus atratus TaxID=8868 RepID=UPI0021B7B3DE|nr:mediator of DNA damage checkpoint protein 1 isoform X3 [Cygnus atratus]